MMTFLALACLNLLARDSEVVSRDWLIATRLQIAVHGLKFVIYEGCCYLIRHSLCTAYVNYHTAGELRIRNFKR